MPYCCRMDFLLLPRGQRVVLEVDGIPPLHQPGRAAGRR